MYVVICWCPGDSAKDVRICGPFATFGEAHETVERLSPKFPDMEFDVRDIATVASVEEEA